jgi:hypothetical protein
MLPAANPVKSSGSQTDVLPFASTAGGSTTSTACTGAKTPPGAEPEKSIVAKSVPSSYVDGVGAVRVISGGASSSKKRKSNGWRVTLRPAARSLRAT